MTTEEKLVWSNLAIHPGETLAEEIEFRGISVDELATQSELSPQLLGEIVKGEKPITSRVARALDASLKIPAKFWINLQSKYDLTVSRNGLTVSAADHSEDAHYHDVEPRIHAELLRDSGSEWSE